MTNLTPFSYADHEVRVLNIDGDPWFVANDAAGPLGLVNVRSSLALLDPDERGVHTVDTPSGEQPVNIISEAGLYSLILRSRRPEAKLFKRWITHEVLPSIRKTGSYAATPQLSPDEIVHQALQITAQRVETLTARLALVEPKALAFDHWLSSNVNYSVAAVAQALAGAGAEMGRQRLFTYMDEQGWIYRHQGQWNPYQHQVDIKRLAVKLGDQLNTRTGERFSTVTIRITPKGAARLAALLHVMPEIVAELLSAEGESESAA